MAKKEVPRDAKEFAHRCNADGSFDSICLFCFHTVGTTATEPELGPFEARHDCNLITPAPNGYNQR